MSDGSKRRSPVSDLTAALEVRRRGQRRRLMRLVSLVTLIALVVGGLVYLFGFSPVFDVRQVKVKGHQLANPRQVVAAAAVPPGTRMARVDSDAVQERVKALPMVAEARVGRSWPHTLRITVTERTMVFQRAEGSEFQWVDAAGKVFHQTGDRLPGLVVQSGSTDPRLLAAVAVVTKALPAEITERTTGLIAASADNLVLELDSGQQVVWGSAEQSELKAEVLSRLLAEKGQVFDVSAPSHPAVR